MTRVARVIQITRVLKPAYPDRLKPSEKLLSYNKVTGHSLNFPIYPTCKPTPVCASRCYFARGGPTWPSALKKQLRMYNSVSADPIAMAERLAVEIEAMLKPPSFIRWNGGGDLFPASVRMLNAFAARLPGMPIWVVTRRADQLPAVVPAGNVYVHFSLDKASIPRRKLALRAAPPDLQLFFSYQVDKGEPVTGDHLRGVSVLFYDGYHPSTIDGSIEPAVVCPLNTAESIMGVCKMCRRCFDGSAVLHARSVQNKGAGTDESPDLRVASAKRMRDNTAM
jgi:hypothetical protein